MTFSDIFSIIALGLSVISISISIYNMLRDRANLLADSKFFDSWEGNQPYILVSIKNSGRRPIIIRMWGGKDDKGKWIGTNLGEKGEGLPLGENGWHEFKILIEDIYNQTPDYSIDYSDLWVEDSLGRRYSIKNAKKNIKLLTKPEE